MGKRKARAAAADEEPQGAGEPPASAEGEAPTDYELLRQQIIQRNRERLLALGIPSLAKALDETVGAAAAAVKRKPGAAAKKKPKKPRGAEAGAEERPTRRSARIQELSMTEEERFERELGQFAEAGECPRCGEAVESGEQRQHLEGCEGPEEPEPEARAPRPRRLDVEMTEEERRDIRKRTLARMKQLSLENLVELTDEAAKFVVLGSTGNHYTVTLGEKCKCECMDFRFRRHHCKHICLALTHLGVLEEPQKWHEAVEAKLSELVQLEAKRAPAGQQPPRSKGDEVALRLL